MSPFDIELRSVERQLDFSEAGKAVTRFLANRNRRLFSMSTENALITLLREGVTVQESAVDSKRDLEDALRSSCNDFIENTCKLVAGNLMQFVEKNRDKVQHDELNGILTETAEGLDGILGDLLEQMSLYLDNPATQSILLKPVSRKVLKSIDDAKKNVLAGSDGWNEDSRGSVLSILLSIEQKVKAAVKGCK